MDLLVWLPLNGNESITYPYFPKKKNGKMAYLKSMMIFEDDFFRFFPSWDGYVNFFLEGNQMFKVTKKQLQVVSEKNMFSEVVLFRNIWPLHGRRPFFPTGHAVDADQSR